MSECVQWARLDSPVTGINQLAWPESSYMYLERIPDAWLNAADRQTGVRLEAFDPETAFEQWEQGRVFCADFELRWELLDGAFQTIYVGPFQDLPGFTQANNLDLSQMQLRQRSYFLWGTRVPPEQQEAVGVPEREGLSVFLELAVPRVLYYPVNEPATRRVKVKVHEFTDRTTGELACYRFAGLEEV